MRNKRLIGMFIYSLLFVSNADALQATPYNKFLPTEIEKFGAAADIIEQITGSRDYYFFAQSLEQEFDDQTTQTYLILRACERENDILCLTLFFKGSEISHESFKGSALLPPKTTFDDVAFSFCEKCPRYFGLIFSDGQENYRGIIITKNRIVF